jgi:glycosyltransferase involved in cell wall biosynthesis
MVDLSIIIPVRNEPNLPSLFRRLACLPTWISTEIIVVVDSAREIITGFPVRIVCNQYSGPGGAIRTGIEAAKGKYVVPFMGDGSDDPDTIHSLYMQAVIYSLDLVCASRYSFGGSREGGPPLARTLSRWAGLSLYALGCVPTRDATNSFKLWRRSALTFLPELKGEGLEITLQMMVCAQQLKLAAAEIPTVWHDRTQGKSKFRFWRWLPQYLKWYLKLLCGRRWRASI